MTLSTRDLFLVLLVASTWGLHAPIIKLGVEEIGPISLNFCRYALTALVFLPLAKKITRDDLIKLIPVSLFFVCGNLIFGYIAMDYITSNSFIVIIQIAQPITIILAYFLFKERFGFFTAFGIAISISGLIIVFGAPDIVEHPIGAALTCVSAFFWALGSLAMKRTGHIDPASFMAYAYLMGVPIALVATLIYESNQIERFLNADHFNVAFVLTYQVIIMGIMTFVWGGLMARNPAQLVTPFLMLQPLFAVVGGYFILGETLNANILWGGLIVLLGIGIINFRKIQKFHQTRQLNKRV